MDDKNNTYSDEKTNSLLFYYLPLSMLLPYSHEVGTSKEV
jgi:hypothetical protein